MAKLFVHIIALVQEPPECQKPCETPSCEDPACVCPVGQRQPGGGRWSLSAGLWHLCSASLWLEAYYLTSSGLRLLLFDLGVITLLLRRVVGKALKQCSQMWAVERGHLCLDERVLGQQKNWDLPRGCAFQWDFTWSCLDSWTSVSVFYILAILPSTLCWWTHLVLKTELAECPQNRVSRMSSSAPFYRRGNRHRGIKSWLSVTQLLNSGTGIQRQATWLGSCPLHPSVSTAVSLHHQALGRVCRKAGICIVPWFLSFEPFSHPLIENSGFSDVREREEVHAYRRWFRIFHLSFGLIQSDFQSFRWSAFSPFSFLVTMCICNRELSFIAILSLCSSSSVWERNTSLFTFTCASGHIFPCKESPDHSQDLEVSVLRIYSRLGCVSAQSSAGWPSSCWRTFLMETHIWWKITFHQRQLEFWRPFFFAMAENHIFPNHITVKVNQRSPTFVANLTSGYNFEV